MILYLIVYTLVFIYLFSLDSQGKIDLSTYWVKHQNKSIFIIELLARMAFLLLLIFVVLAVVYSKISFNWWALILQIIALLLFWISKRTMAQNWATNINNQQKTLTKSGVFKYSRNPVYVAYHCLFISMLFYDFWFFILSYLFFAIIFHRLILSEEKYLKSCFRDEYLEYTKQTRRYF